MHRLALHNEQLCDTSAAVLSPGQIGLLSGWGVFSTMRIVRGIPFAFERHWDRMRRDAATLNVPFPDDAEAVRSRLLELIRANDAADATLRIVVVRNRGGLWEGPSNRPYDVIAFTTDAKDWGGGSRLAVVEQGRHAASPFHGLKSLSWALNLTMAERAHQQGFHEVVLLNERGEVSECTSANIFAATKNEVWTPPLDSGCLPGVTRDVLLREISVDGITVKEKVLQLEDLKRADEVFITSTTRNLLAVVEIDGHALPPAGNVRTTLAAAFERYVESYVRKFL